MNKVKKLKTEIRLEVMEDSSKPFELSIPKLGICIAGTTPRVVLARVGNELKRVKKVDADYFFGVDEDDY